MVDCEWLVFVGYFDVIGLLVLVVVDKYFCFMYFGFGFVLFWCVSYWFGWLGV